MKTLRFNTDPRFKRSIQNGQPSLQMTRRQEQVSDISAGSVLQGRHSMPVMATRYFTDPNGQIIAKNDAGLVAVGMDTDYPLFVLGEFDRQGGYRCGLTSLQPRALPGFSAPVVLTSFVNGVTGTSNNIITPFSPFNTIQGQLRQGDLVTVYVDNITTPNFYCWMVQTNNYAALSAIVANLKSNQQDRRLGTLFCYEVNWYCSEAQWDYPLHFITSDNLGTWTDNQVQPSIFKMPFNVLEGFITVKTDFIVDQYIEIGLMYLIGTDSMSFNFNLKKIN